MRRRRSALSRLQTDASENKDDVNSKAGRLLEVLEQYMHRTGARFTDVFFLLDRREPGGGRGGGGGAISDRTIVSRTNDVLI